MKYLKIYEGYKLGYFRKKTLNNIFYKWRNQNLDTVEIFSCMNEGITNLKGAENIPNVTDLNCSQNPLNTLEGIEYLTKLEKLNCDHTNIRNLKGIENLINLTSISCYDCDLQDLKGIENLIKLKILRCNNNKIQNIDDIDILYNLKELFCSSNPWEYPVPFELKRKYSIYYQLSDKIRFSTYESQKKFLTKFPERIEELKEFGIHEKIKEEFPDLVEGSEFGFFNLR